MDTVKDRMDIWVIGGDMRQVKLSEALSDDGHSVHSFALEKAQAGSGVRQEESLAGASLADCVILPLPAEGEGGVLNAPLSDSRCTLEMVFDALQPGQVVCAGKVTPRALALAAERSITLRDYFAREELAIGNAVPTAEGAIQLAMEELSITIQGCRVLVLGYGRVGQATASRFAALGAKVSVAARKYADLARAESVGLGVEQIGALREWLCGYDLVVNTVPARVLGEEELSALREGCLVIDLASRPGGVDFSAAAALGVRAIWALSLPGKVAPVSSGRYIRDTIYNILRELGV